MIQSRPALWWVRRDLRLADNAALLSACEGGGPVIPVFVWDALDDALGAAPKWRLGEGLRELARTLETSGSRLILRRGDALTELRRVIDETGAGSVRWTRLYTPDTKARDTEVKAGLKADGFDARSFAGHLLFEPWTVQTKTGGYYRVYTPMWKAVRGSDISGPYAAPSTLPAPEVWPNSDQLSDWRTGAAMKRGAAIVAPHANIGEENAARRLDSFIADIVADYDRTRDLPAINGTSNLSENLALGEISPRTCWHAGQRARAEGKAGAETFLKELVWREFAYHLTHHTPHLLTGNWREEWDGFPWNTDADHPHVIAWKQGRTGVRFVDAAMRELYVTGRMHNRGRMIVASYLTKHLLTDWRIGLDWFADCLIDWDPASNAMGWQWSAGSGPDATPYFRVFNPETQLDKFDPDRAYANRWIAEGLSNPTPDALAYFDAIPRAWGLTSDAPYPKPIVTASEGRARALDAYHQRAF
ncbi:MAG: deoxyribodipyrimidine photo-lyase [Pseudomonadota bacterium]